MNESVERLLENDDFSVFMPDSLDIIEKSGEDIEETRPIQGWCSTENLDRQDEIVVAKGLDFSEFVKHGYFNDNHKQETSSILGYPRMVRLEKNRWWTEGNLLKGFAPADKVWELAKAMRKSNAPRKLGFSIEGKVMERDGHNRIVRAKVRNVAITNCPVNTDCTWDIMAKAMASSELVERAAQKALTAGHGTPHSGGSALRADNAIQEMVRSKNLSFAEAVERVQQRHPNISKATCRRIVRLAMCQD